MPAYKDAQRGTWYVKYSQNNRQVLKRGFRTKREALDYERKAKLAEAPAHTMTFAEVAESYFEYADQADSTRVRQIPMINKYATFADLDYADLSKKVLVDWYIDLGRKDLADPTKNLILRVVKSIFKYGAEYYDLPDYAHGLKAYKQSRKEMQTWTPEEFSRFAQAVTSYPYRAYFTFLYCTGCRMMEGANIQYTDLDGDRLHIRGTKTSKSDRWIILAPSVRAILEPFLARCTEEEPYIFSGAKPFSNTSIFHVFKRAIRASGVKEIRVHDLRHSFATNAIASGCDIVAVSKYLGHTDITTTMRTYAHLLEHTERDMVDKVEEICIKSVSNIEKTA